MVDLDLGCSAILLWEEVATIAANLLKELPKPKSMGVFTIQWVIKMCESNHFALQCSCSSSTSRPISAEDTDTVVPEQVKIGLGAAFGEW